MAGNSPLGEVEKYPYTRAWWPDIQYEGGISTRYILDHVPNAKIGTLMLNNDLANSETVGIQAALGANASERLVGTTYEPSQVDVSSQVLQLRQAGVNAIISQGGVQAINAVKYMNQIGWNPMLFLYGAGSGRKATLGVIGLEQSKGLYTPLWLKDPNDPQWANDPGVAAYKQAIQKYGEGADPGGHRHGQWLRCRPGVRHGVEEHEGSDAPGTDASYRRDEERAAGHAVSRRAAQRGPGGCLIFSYQICQFDGDSWKPVGGVLDAIQLGLAK